MHSSYPILFKIFLKLKFKLSSKCLFLMIALTINIDIPNGRMMQLRLKKRSLRKAVDSPMRSMKQ